MATTNKPDSVIGAMVKTPKGRLSYPHLLAKNTGGTYPSDKYETELLIPKSADISALQNAVKALAKEAFGDKVKKMTDLVYPPIKDGDADEEENGARKGHWYLRAKSTRKPGIVGPGPECAPFDAPEEEVYGGANARLSLKPCSYKQGGKPGITWLLQNVQIFPGGERFGVGASNPQDDFSDDDDGGATAADEDMF